MDLRMTIDLQVDEAAETVTITLKIGDEQCVYRAHRKDWRTFTFEVNGLEYPTVYQIAEHARHPTPQDAQLCFAATEMIGKAAGDIRTVLEDETRASVLKTYGGLPAVEILRLRRESRDPDGG